MATPQEHEEIVKGLRVMINGFVTKGILSCSEMDILKDRLPPERNDLFLSYGIDLKLAITCCPLDPIISLAKIEPGVINEGGIFQSKDVFFDKVNIKVEEPTDDNYFLDYENDPETEFKEESFESDEEPLFKKWKNVVKKKKESVKKEPVSKPTGIHLKCKQCEEVFGNKEDFKTHTDDHFFNEVRILSSKTSNFDYVAYLSFKEFMKKKEKLRNNFVFQVPPPDFTKEDYQNFTFPKPIEEYIQTDLSAKLKKLPGSNGYKCTSCKMTLNNMIESQEHFLKMHDVHFKCPYDNCNFNKNPTATSLLKFARHTFYHERPLIQLSLPHICIACGYRTPYMACVEQHLKSFGPLHDNKCVRCEERFQTRQDMLKHIMAMKHEGVACGYCREVFEDEGKVKAHLRHYCNQKVRKGTVCADCGKTYAYVDEHRKIQHGEKDPQKCDECGLVCNNKYHLSHHKAQKHAKNRPKIPCAECGHMVRSEYMKSHIQRLHTPDHLKPFVCKTCGKGFLHVGK